jgi:Family of unknown function (DUF5361)
VRRCWLLIQNLPPDSALARAHDPQAVAWPLSNHLLAAIFDTLQLSNWQRSGDAKAEKPAQLPRPGVASPASRTEANARAFLERQRQREGR